MKGDFTRQPSGRVHQDVGSLATHESRTLWGSIKNMDIWAPPSTYSWSGRLVIFKSFSQMTLTCSQVENHQCPDRNFLRTL